ncbi:MAG TPA: hypothetical protein DCX06_00455 [Opitutae bacterium]|nr:hypothetical protein [Opitutae bacterium]
MISATGKPRRRNRGFTILEIVLVLGLVALAGSLMIANFTSMADRGGELNTEETLQAAIRKARFDAARDRTNVTLNFDPESGSLMLSSGESFPLGEAFTQAGRGKVVFYMVPPAAGLSPFNDPEKTRLQTPEIIFAPDRSSTPFVVDIERPNTVTERFTFDSFSSLRRKVE